MILVVFMISILRRCVNGMEAAAPFFARHIYIMPEPGSKTLIHVMVLPDLYIDLKRGEVLDARQGSVGLPFNDVSAMSVDV